MNKPNNPNKPRNPSASGKPSQTGEKSPPRRPSPPLERLYVTGLSYGDDNKNIPGDLLYFRDTTIEEK